MCFTNVPLVALFQPWRKLLCLCTKRENDCRVIAASFCCDEWGISKFPAGQLDPGTIPLHQAAVQPCPVCVSVWSCCVQQSNLVPVFRVLWVFSFLILEQVIFHQRPLVTHYTLHMPNRGWVSSWIRSIPCLSLSSSPTQDCRFAKRAETFVLFASLFQNRERWVCVDNHFLGAIMLYQGGVKCWVGQRAVVEVVSNQPFH